MFPGGSLLDQPLIIGAIVDSHFGGRQCGNGQSLPHSALDASSVQNPGEPVGEGSLCLSVALNLRWALGALSSLGHLTQAHQECGANSDWHIQEEIEQSCVSEAQSHVHVNAFVP